MIVLFVPPILLSLSASKCYLTMRIILLLVLFIPCSLSASKCYLVMASK